MADTERHGVTDSDQSEGRLTLAFAREWILFRSHDQNGHHKMQQIPCPNDADEERLTPHPHTGTHDTRGTRRIRRTFTLELRFTAGGRA